MLRKSSILAIALVLFAGNALADDSGTDSQQNWKVWEGPAGSTKGFWNVSIVNGTVVGQSIMTTIVNQQVGYQIVGTVAAGQYDLTTTSSIDNSQCSYSGQLASDGVTIQGTQSCADSSSPWTAIMSAPVAN